MELSHLGALEELLLPQRRDSFTNLSSSSLVHDFIIPIHDTPWIFDSFDHHQNPNSSFSELTTTLPPAPLEDGAAPFQPCAFDGFVIPEIESPPLIPSTAENELQEYEQCPSTVEDQSCCKLEVDQTVMMSGDEVVNRVFEVGFCGEKRSRSKRLQGQPSKNLMAERRRRKRLNDRLSMLRSIVPKISKMDRTSILGDAIDYMKELLEKISKLQEQEQETGVTNKVKLLGDVKEAKQSDGTVRNSPKFDVERRGNDTRINICCAAKPGLLPSTVNTIEALGLEIQQCVISCFSDFSLQASCSEAGEQREPVSCEDIKQALFRNAGYGGRCL